MNLRHDPHTAASTLAILCTVGTVCAEFQLSAPAARLVQITVNNVIGTHWSSRQSIPR